MRKVNYNLKFFTEDNVICISQQDDIRELEDNILISVDQVDTLIEWLHEAKHEILGTE